MQVIGICRRIFIAVTLHSMFGQDKPCIFSITKHTTIHVPHIQDLFSHLKLGLSFIISVNIDGEMATYLTLCFYVDTKCLAENHPNLTCRFANS